MFTEPINGVVDTYERFILKLRLRNEQSVASFNERVLERRIFTVGAFEIQQHVDCNHRSAHLFKTNQNCRQIYTPKGVLIIFFVEFLVGINNDDIVSRAR